MKKWIIALALLAGTGSAAEKPTIVGTIANQAGGQIVLTFSGTKECAPRQMLFVYVRDAGGKISLSGCWRIEGDSVYVFWEDGDVYEYDGLEIQFTEAWLRYANAQQGIRS